MEVSVNIQIRTLTLTLTANIAKIFYILKHLAYPTSRVISSMQVQADTVHFHISHD